MSDARQIDVHHLLSLAGETVLVTGASGNIGRGIARRLAEALQDDPGLGARPHAFDRPVHVTANKRDNL